MIDKSGKRIITFTSADGFEVNALLTLVNKKNSRSILNTPILIQVHGVLGNFLARGTPRLLPPGLLEKGINSLSINTRMAFMGQIFGYGVYEDTIEDIDAAVSYLEAQGFTRIYVLGYSLGANLVAYYCSLRNRSNITKIKGIILEGCSYSLPESQKSRLDKWSSIPSYDEIYRNARNALGPDPKNYKNDRVFVVYRAWGPSFNPVDCEMFSYKTWWFMRSPEADNAKTYKHIDKVKNPVLFINGKEDDIVSLWEPRDLKKILDRAGNKNVKLRYIPGAKHDCMENPGVTLTAVANWIKKIK